MGLDQDELQQNSRFRMAKLPARNYRFLVQFDSHHLQNTTCQICASTQKYTHIRMGNSGHPEPDKTGVNSGPLNFQLFAVGT